MKLTNAGEQRAYEKELDSYPDLLEAWNNASPDERGDKPLEPTPPEPYDGVTAEEPVRVETPDGWAVAPPGMIVATRGTEVRLVHPDDAAVGSLWVMES